MHAIALKSLMRDGVRSLTSGERALLCEWLDRIATGDGTETGTRTTGPA